MARTAGRLFRNNYQWSVLSAGSCHMQVAAQATSMDGHVRVGLADYPWLDKGALAKTNAELVTRVLDILEALVWKSQRLQKSAKPFPLKR